MLKALTIQESGELRTVELEDVDGSHLEALQAAVGGLIEAVQLDERTTMYLNEEGLYLCRFNELATMIARSFGFTHQPYYGPAVIVGGVDDEGRDESLSDEALARVLRPFGITLTGLKTYEEIRDESASALLAHGGR